MAEKRKCELYLVRVVPHPLRDDFMTVGCVLVESGGEFVDVRFTRDWKRIECFAPEIELEHFERLEAEVRKRLKEIRGRESLAQLLEAEFGALFEVGPTKAVEAGDPAAEMAVIERDFLAAMQPVTERARRMGRLGIVSRMEEEFSRAGVLGLMQRDLEMTEFTGENDPFRVDFGFRVGSSLKMFHALALSLSRDPALVLAYRYGRIREGMRKRSEEALLTAVVSEEARQRDEAASGIGMLRANEIAVRVVEEMAEVAEEVRRDLGI